MNALAPPPVVVSSSPVVLPASIGRWEEPVRAFLIDLRRRGYSLLTLRDYQGDLGLLRRHAAAAPEELDEARVADALAALERLGFGPSVLRRKHAAFHSFLTFLKSRRRTEPLGAALWRRAAHEPACDRLLLGLIIAAGVRLSELARMEGRDLRLRAGEVWIRSGWRIIPMHPALRDLVIELRHALPMASFRPLLPGLNGFPVNTRTMHARFRRLTARLGLPQVRPDDLRREAAAHLAAQGAPSGMISAFLARDRGRPIAPRKGKLVDLTSLAAKLASFRLVLDAPAPAPDIPAAGAPC